MCLFIFKCQQYQLSGETFKIQLYFHSYKSPTDCYSC